jgi:hypothetical protein
MQEMLLSVPCPSFDGTEWDRANVHGIPPPSPPLVVTVVPGAMLQPGTVLYIRYQVPPSH